MVLVDEIVSELQVEIAQLPNRFYDSFEYTTTGNNYTHPVTLGLIAKILWQVSGVRYVAVDIRLNDNGAKFQPDLTALANIEKIEPLVFLDYESPNSSDGRIPTKDISAYKEWSKACNKKTPYLIVTTLPDKTVADWELRYTAKEQYNCDYKGRREDICKNPFAFWYSEYRRLIKDVNGIYFINIDGKTAKQVTL